MLMPAPIAAVIASSPSTVAGILTITLGRSTLFHSCVRLLDGRGGVVSEVGRDLDRDPAVVAPARVVDGPEDVGRVAHVVGRGLEDRGVDVGAGDRQRVQLVLVALALGECAGEDRRVRGDADDVAFGDQSLEAARRDSLTGQVVEPDAHAGL